MKNHKWVDGKLLQTNKKWSHLKGKQKNWIFEVTKEECDKFIVEQGKQPRKNGKEIVLDRVIDKIQEREIWIPYNEPKRNICKYIDRYNRKNILSIADNGKVSSVKKSEAIPKPKE